MAELLAIQVLSHHLGRHLGHHFGNFNFFLGTLFFAYSLNLSQISSQMAQLLTIKVLSRHIGHHLGRHFGNL